MTCEEYLDLQEARVLDSLSKTARATGVRVQEAIDLEGHVRRRPALAMGAGAAAGFMVGQLLASGTRGAARGTLQTIWTPLIRPTVRTAGSMLARFLLGAAAPTE
jgi:hypothetical protein